LVIGAFFALSAVVQPVAVSYFSNSTEDSPLILVFGDIRVINEFARNYPYRRRQMRQALTGVGPKGESHNWKLNRELEKY